jgi:hypothetical protein
MVRPKGKRGNVVAEVGKDLGERTTVGWRRAVEPRAQLGRAGRQPDRLLRERFGVCERPVLDGRGCGAQLGRVGVRERPLDRPAQLVQSAVNGREPF